MTSLPAIPSNFKILAVTVYGRTQDRAYSFGLDGKPIRIKKDLILFARASARRIAEHVQSAIAFLSQAVFLQSSRL